MSGLILKNVKKSFGKVKVIHGIDLEVEEGEFIVIVGPSGCGKSTLLRMIAGLENVTDGDILIDNLKVNDKEPMDRNIAMVFQNYALYPHMSVFNNMAYGLKIAGLPKAEITERVSQAATMLELDGLLDRKPRELSGGQRQRVAMGRAIVRQPLVFLFDEPLSNLDAKLRIQMRLEIKSLQQRLGTTSLFVTHDQNEAMTMADRIMVLSEGRLEQFGTPMDLYHRPKTKFVAGFIGHPKMNFLSASCLSIDSDGVKVELPAIGKQLLPVEPLKVNQGEELEVGVRPEDLMLSETGKGLPLKVDVLERLGGSTLVYGSLDKYPNFCAMLQGDANVREGELVNLDVKPASFHVFDSNGNAMKRREVPEILK
jgi:multiple sugar transport system ATP-binding protein